MDSTPFDDSHLLDHILDGRESEATDSLEPEARKRFEELQRLHALLSLADPLADVTGLSHAQRDAVVDRFQVGQAHSRPQRNTPLIRLLPFRLRYVAAAAVVMLLTLLGWSVFGPSTTDNTVYANVFGGIELSRDGKAIQPVAHRLRLQSGDVVNAQGGGEINLGNGSLLRVSRDTRFACLQIADTDVVLDLQSGRFRCETLPAGVTLTLLMSGMSLRTRNGVFSVQYMNRPDDQLLVDQGEVEIRARDQSKVHIVRRDSDRFSLTRFCPASQLPPEFNLQPCCKCRKRPGAARCYPMQTDHDAALALARTARIPVLISREDGPRLTPCYNCCCFVDFNHKRHAMAGLVWLLLDPTRHAAELRRYNLDANPRAVVVLNSQGEVIDRGQVKKDGTMYGTVLNLIRAGKKACK